MSSQLLTPLFKSELHNRSICLILSDVVLTLLLPHLIYGDSFASRPATSDGHGPWTKLEPESNNVAPTGTMMKESFDDLVAHEFAFVEAAGFKRCVIAPTMIEYASARVRLVIVWDQYSGELDAIYENLDRSEIGSNQYSLADIMMAANENLGNISPRQVYHVESLAPFVAELALNVRTYGMRALVCDIAFLQRLDGDRSRRGQRLMQRIEQERVRDEAQKAWIARDYSAVVRLLVSIDEHLSPSERLKLEYARKHLATHRDGAE